MKYLINVPIYYFYLKFLSGTQIVSMTFEVMFDSCSSLLYLPDISKWNTSNIRHINGLFNNCLSLISLPDISKWKINVRIKAVRLFNNCLSLISLPDISKWNTYNDSSTLSIIDIIDITSDDPQEEGSIEL